MSAGDVGELAAIEAIHPAFLVLGGTAGLVYQALGQDEARGAEVARAARLSASATSAALRVLAEHGLAERGPGGWRRGPVALADVAESTGAADLQREREERYRQDRESWRARLRQYQGARQRARDVARRLVAAGRPGRVRRVLPVAGAPRRLRARAALGA